MVIGRDWDEGRGQAFRRLYAREVGSRKEKSCLFSLLAHRLRTAGSRCCAVSLLHGWHAWGPAMSEVHEIQMPQQYLKKVSGGEWLSMRNPGLQLEACSTC